MKIFRGAAAVLLLASVCFADMTPEQKLADFRQLAGLYAKNYAPYEWKRDVLGFDLYDIKPWLAQVTASKDDVEFWDICVRYVASLQDSHDEYFIPSTFSAYLHFDVDIYDGKVLVDGVDRSYLARTKYPFTVGDELVSVDGVAASDLVKAYLPYSVNGSGNPVSRQRLAAETITLRYQDVLPKAHLIPADATVVIQRASGAVETYTIPWDKRGTALTTAGTLPNLPASKKTRAAAVDAQPLSDDPNYRIHLGDTDGPTRADRWGGWQGQATEPEIEDVPSYLQPLKDLQTLKGFNLFNSNFNNTVPVFDPPPGFKLRLGTALADQFFSGTFNVSGATIGFIRIPTFAPANTNAALQQFANEIVFLDRNTNALIIDIMNNGGGDGCYTETLVSLLTSGKYGALKNYVRATDSYLILYAQRKQAAINAKAPQYVIDLYDAYVQDMQSAIKDNRALTGALPVCGPSPDATGLSFAYSKPIVVLVNELSLSSAEVFPMMLQDAGRATIVGTRTDGGGGSPASWDAGVYSEGMTRVTRTFVVREQEVKTPGFPSSRYLENIGVYPDVVLDYQTLDNLSTGGSHS